MKPCSKCDAARAAASKINGMKNYKPKSKVNFAHMGGMLVGYKVANEVTKMVRGKKDGVPNPTGMLDGTVGSLIKTAAGIGLSMYSKPGSLLQGVGDGIAFNGGVGLLTGFGVSMSGLEGARMGMGANVRYNRLASQIAGHDNVREMEPRQKVYANVA